MNFKKVAANIVHRLSPTSSSWPNSENSESSSQNPISSVVDSLNTCIQEVMSELSQEPNSFGLRTLRKISRAFYSAIASPKYSKQLMVHVVKLSHMGRVLPRWCQQLLLIKKCLRLDTDPTSVQNIGQQQMQSPISSWLIHLVKLSPKEMAFLRELVWFLDPIYLMLVELSPSNTEAIQSEADHNQSNWVFYISSC